MNNKRIENNLNYSSFGWFNKCKEISEFSHKDIKDKNLINVLWSEVRELSNKQISLVDIMAEVQANSQNQIEDLSIKIVNINEKIKELNEGLCLL